MKRLAVICCLMFSFLFAQDCEVKSWKNLNITYPAVEINLPNDDMLDLSKMSFILPKIENFSMNDSVYWAYLAQSDSSIMVFVQSNAVKFFKICSSEKECGEKEKDFFVKDVIVDEFNRLQLAGVFRESALDVDSLIHHIIEKIESNVVSRYGYSTLSYLPEDDMAYENVTAAAFCAIRRSPFSGDLCGLIDTVRQCKLHFEPPMLLRNSLLQKNPPKNQISSFHARDAAGKILQSNTIRRVKY